MGQFKKGQSGNPNGRPKGSENRATKETRKFLVALLENHFDSIANHLTEMDAIISEETDRNRKFKLVERKLNLVLRLLPYVLPTLKSENFSYFEAAPFDWEEFKKTGGYL